ncbi:uncharacterized protein LOC142985839 [Anticarsia gemmatalis]|uniref:uncharacterized protein LOC142985839 n=1 Tax=Anticarsia gemmatalis TaxID=129554 RepID=UPI003F775D46
MSTGEEKAVVLEGQGISAVSLTARIPEFWKTSPKLWFIQEEAVLSPQKMSDESKYELVITKLSKDVIEQVTEILINPPEKQKFETLKQRLISIYQESEDMQLKKLIGEMELGEQKSSQLLRKMQDLARGKVSNETLAVLWQNHLPSAVRGVLAVADSKELDTLASIADKVAETLTPVQGIASIQNKPETSNCEDRMIAEIQKLSDKLNEMNTRTRGSWRRGNYKRFRSRSNSRNRGRGRTPDHPNWLCHYHFRYRQRASKCIPPCNWKEGGTKKAEEN